MFGGFPLVPSQIPPPLVPAWVDEVSDQHTSHLASQRPVSHYTLLRWSPVSFISSRGSKSVPLKATYLFHMSEPLKSTYIYQY